MKITTYKSNDTKKIDTIRESLCQTRNVGLDIIRSFAILFVIAGHFLMNTSFNSSIFEGGVIIYTSSSKNAIHNWSSALYTSNRLFEYQ